MKRIGVLFGVENSFPGALVERINSIHPEDIEAEFVLTGSIALDQPSRYAVIVDRISHVIPFYRALLKHAALQGTVVINNPFWASADDKFFNYAVALSVGVAVPPTVLLPHKDRPNDTSERSLRNLEYPLDWDAVFKAIGEHGYLKPIDGGGWRDVTEVRGRAEFFRAYDNSRDECMVYQKAVEYTDYFRCYVVGQSKVRVMAYDPRRPHEERYHARMPRGLAARRLLRRMERDARTLCRALGYDFNSVEFGVENGIPFAIDFMNAVPDTDPRTVGEKNFNWVVDQMARLTISKAKRPPRRPGPDAAKLLVPAGEQKLE